MPLPSGRVIDPRSGAHHQPVAEGAMTGRCRIRGKGTVGTWTPADGETGTTARPLLYDALPCRVQVAPATDRNADAAGQDVATREYVAQVPLRADIPVGAVITVISNPDDRQLEGRTLTVLSIEYGTQRWDRVARCVDDLTNQAGA